MSTVLRLIAELAHWTAALPLLTCVYLWLRRVEPGRICWGIGVACLVSVLVDSIAGQLASQGYANAWLGFIAAPLEMGVLLWALASRPLLRRLLLAGLLLVAIASAMRGPWDRQETVIELVGGVLVCGLLPFAPLRKGYQASVAMMCGVTIPATIGMVLAPIGGAVWIACWVVFQGCRIAGATIWVTTALRQPWFLQGRTA